MKDNLRGECIAELLGTALLIFFGVGCVAAARVAGADLSLWGISIIWGFGVALAVYATAGVSGAHLNPAVTLAFWVFAKFPGRKVIPFIVAQTVGAFIAAAIVYYLYSNVITNTMEVEGVIKGSQESIFYAGIFSTYPDEHISLMQAFSTELIITAILVGLIMALTDDGNGVPRGPLAPLLIGIVIAVIGGSLGPLTGFAMNPARDFGPKFFAYLAGWGNIALTGGREIPYVFVPILAPFIGGLIGGLGYRCLVAQYLPNNIAAREKE